jgi:transcription elongation factor Elf1|tara:strand:+ start:1180 stop:1434 length:255 start_codon:yes stop_codon:yes gene_type:complete
MKKIRRIKPGQRKRERREASKKLEAQAAAFLDHDMECCVCGAEFERTQTTVQEWMVVASEDHKPRLTCPSCWKLIEKEVENRNV